MSTLAVLVIEARTHQDPERRREAFGELVQRFQDAAYSWAFRLLGDGHLAQDATQEAFVTAYQQLSQLREPDAFGGWLRKIVVSQAHRLRRGQRPAASDAMEKVVETAVDGPAAAVERIELKDKVLAAIQALPEHEQVVTKMFYLNGYSQQEIARMLELPLTTVKKRLQYAREHLKQIMVAMFAPPPAPVPIPVPVRTRRRTPGPADRW